MKEVSPEALFDLEGLGLADLFEGLDLAWEALDRIKPYILERLQPNVADVQRDGGLVLKTTAIWRGRAYDRDLELIPGDVNKGRFQVKRLGEELPDAAVVYAGAALMDDQIELKPGAVVEPGALIKGPTIIGPRTEVRQGAYLRGACLTGEACVVGHTTEMKNAAMLDGAKAGHFAYLGDSILGRDVNLGAGTKLANLKIMPWPYRIKVGDQTVEIDRRKFGAILGDKVETGCNTVTSPGLVMGRGCLVTPNTTAPSGYLPPKSFVKAPAARVVSRSR